MIEKYNIKPTRLPDEVFIFIDNKDENAKKINIKVLEKKYQESEGSVDTKLWAGPSIKREYQLHLGEKFIVDYGFSLSKFFENKFNSEDDSNLRWKYLLKIFDENSISVFYGHDEKYYDKLLKWTFPQLNENKELETKLSNNDEITDELNQMMETKLYIAKKKSIKKNKNENKEIIL